VSLDEEMADLMRYQRSFQASSRVVAVIDELLETVVNRLGA
jgi:flagellar hook-associated protein 1 FlgK